MKSPQAVFAGEGLNQCGGVREPDAAGESGGLMLSRRLRQQMRFHPLKSRNSVGISRVEVASKTAER